MIWTARLPLATAAVLIAATGLTGCAALHLDPATSIAPQAEASRTAPSREPTPVPQELPAFAVGDIVEPAIAEALNDVRGYEMPDGKFVLVNANEPLPAAIQDALNNQIATNYDPSSSNLSLKESKALGYQVAGKTGKNILVVGQLITSNEAGQNYPIWRVADYSDRDLTTREDAIASAQEIIPSQPDPQRWAIIG